ncbi:MAG TPA: helix-turn-helix domain-containing protein [Candidatus Bathyarchaeia archaeon]
MREIVLQLKAPENWVSEVTSKHPSTIRILDCKPGDSKDGIRQLVEITADPKALESVVDEVRGSPLVKEAYIVETKRGKVIGSLLTESVLCGMLMSSNAFCRTCLFHSKSKPDGSVEWTLALTGREALTDLLDRLKKEKIDVKIVRLTSVADVETLTAHQRSIVQTALEEGYFDYPRRISLRQLAKRAGVSSATVSEVLRRAEKKILSTYSMPGRLQSQREESGLFSKERERQDRVSQ